MAKELPYFKFYVSEWNDGDITLEDYETQGLFINLCSYYWSNECELSLKKAQKKFITQIDLGFKILIEEKIISVKKDMVKISFLDEQWKERRVKALTNRENGAKGGRPKKNPIGLISLTQPETETEPKQKAIRREEKRRDNTVARVLIEDKHKEFTIKFYQQLKERGVINKSIAVNDSLIHHIRKLETVDKIKWDDIKNGANYYFNNLDVDFMPEIQGTKSFRDKFDKLVAHKKRQP